MGVPDGTDHGSLKLYIIGFILSLILTFLSYAIVVEELLVGWQLLGAVAFLAASQAIVQLILFLHLGSESKPRWNLLVFLFMVLVLLIIVLGSLWIMYNLDYRMM
jgi:cytochrome o ubiquinol oxidase operon protein cyoD